MAEQTSGAASALNAIDCSLQAPGRRVVADFQGN